MKNFNLIYIYPEFAAKEIMNDPFLLSIDSNLESIEFISIKEDVDQFLSIKMKIDNILKGFDTSLPLLFLVHAFLRPNVENFNCKDYIWNPSSLEMDRLLNYRVENDNRLLSLKLVLKLRKVYSIFFDTDFFVTTNNAIIPDYCHDELKEVFFDGLYCSVYSWANLKLLKFLRSYTEWRFPNISCVNNLDMQ